ncbi:hypothetical protein ACGVWS_00905 [Enterobacteriaceae bacterium LUAb1]
MMVILFFSVQTYATEKYKLVFENEDYKIVMDIACSPCDISCKNITFKLRDKKRGDEINTVGRTLNVGINSNFRGYIFHQGNYTWSLTEPQNDDDIKNNIWHYSVDKKVQGKYKTITEQKINMTFDNGSC